MSLSALATRWPCAPLKHVVDLNPETLPESTDEDFEFDYIDIGSIVEGTVSTTQRLRFADAPSRARRRVRYGDVLVSTVRTYLRAVAGVPGRLDGDVASTGFAVLRPDPSQVDPRYLRYWCLSEPFISEVVSRSVGVSYPAINASELVSLRIATPPLSVQRHVADHLDHETQRLDGIIARHGEMLSLLREREQAALERMLETAAGPRPQLRRVAELTPGYAFKSKGFRRVPDDSVRLLRGVNVTPFGIDWSTDTVWWDADDLAGVQHYRLHAGDLVVGMDRPWISTGLRVAEILPDDEPSYLVQRVLRVRPLALLDPDYCRLALRSDQFYAHFEADMTGVSVPHVSAEQIGTFLIPLPSLEDQQRLARSVLDDHAQANALAGLLRQQNALLVERRQALITAAVTGQLDLQEAA